MPVKPEPSKDGAVSTPAPRPTVAPTPHLPPVGVPTRPPIPVSPPRVPSRNAPTPQYTPSVLSPSRASASSFVTGSNATNVSPARNLKTSRR